jgi:hypothetical protein
MQAFSAAGQEMYQSQAAASGGTGEAGPAGTRHRGARRRGGRGVVEADYEIVDEEK